MMTELKQLPPPSIPNTRPLPRAGTLLDAIGKTPLVRLERILRPRDWTLYAKLDGLNPAGSTKDRAAIRAITDAMERGEVDRDTLIVESSSGNMGVGLAQACSYLGLRFHCVVDPHTTQQNILLMRAYGAHVEVVQHCDPITKSYLSTRIARVKELLAANPNSFWTNQYENLSCVASHADTTAPEIVTQLGAFPDYFFCSVGTCATIQGCAQYFHEQGAHTKIVAVDAIGSVILGGEPAARKIPGMGSARKSSLLDMSLIDIPVHTDEDEAIDWCRRMAREEALLVGGSSGAVVAAVAQLQAQIPPGATVVTLLPDRGERYMDLIFGEDTE